MATELTLAAGAVVVGVLVLVGGTWVVVRCLFRNGIRSMNNT